MEFVVNGTLDLAAIEEATDAEFACGIKYATMRGETTGIRVSNYGPPEVCGYWIEFTCGGAYHSHTSFLGANGRRHNDSKSLAFNVLESYMKFVREQNENVRSS